MSTPSPASPEAETLAPCPFCGSHKLQVHRRPDGIFSWVFCGPCGAHGPVEEGKLVQESPEARWNRRATPPAPGGADLRPITMQDVRLAVGEGELSWSAVLAGCNAELRRRSGVSAPPAATRAGTVGAVELVEAAIREGSFFTDTNYDQHGRFWRLDEYARAMLIKALAALVSPSPAPRGEALSADRFVADIAMIDATKNAIDFLVAHFGPVASDDPEGWSDQDARETHGRLTVALKKRIDAAQAVNADFEITDADWEEALAEETASLCRDTQAGSDGLCGGRAR